MKQFIVTVEGEDRFWTIECEEDAKSMITAIRQLTGLNWQGDPWLQWERDGEWSLCSGSFIIGQIRRA